MVGRVLGAALALAMLCFAGFAQARPYSVEDLLSQETFGAQAVDPSGRWMVFEERDPYRRAPRFDWDLHTSEALTRLRLIDLQGSGRARPLIKGDPGPGVTLGPFSPSGARLAVFRLRGTQVTLGIVTVASGAVRWLPITPERPDWGRGLQWLSDRTLLVIARPGGVASWSYREGRASASRLPDLWRRSAAGDVGATAVGSGAYAAVRPRHPASHLVGVDVVTGARRALAAGEFRDLEISPDRSRVALFEAGRDLQPHGDGPSQGLQGISDQAGVLSVLDLRSGVRRFPCPGQDAAPHLLAWSPSGAQLLVFARPTTALWTEGRLQVVDAATGVARSLAPELQPVLEPVLDLRPEVVHAAWMGEQVLVLARRTGAARADWYRLAASGPINLTAELPRAPRLLAAIDADRFVTITDDAVWTVTAAGEATRTPVASAMLAQAPRTTAGTQRLDLVAGPGAWLVTGPAAARRLAWLDTAGRHDEMALPADTDPTLVASRARGAALLSSTDVRGVTELRLVKAGAASRQVARINVALAEVEPPEVRPVRHLGPDGQPLTSWLFLPPSSGLGRLPLVVQAYAGINYASAPHDYPGERGFLIHIQTLVGHGYAVLVASLPSPRDHRDPMSGLGDRLVAIVDAVSADPELAKRVDTDHPALWGHSYGGYTVMAAVAQTDRFSSGVALSGLSDLISKWETMPAVYRAAPEDGLHNNWSSGSVESGQDGMLTPPWVDPARYIRNSPLFAAEHIHTPLFLAHGDQDVVPLPQSEAMFSALYRQSRDAELVTYFGEGHLIESPGNVRDLYRRAFAFLDEHFSRARRASAATPPESPARAPASGEPRPRS